MLEDAFIIGGKGIVGQATAKMFGIPYYFDKKESNITLGEGAKKLFCFLCLPTPTDTRGVQQGIDDIKAYISQLKEYGGRNIFIIRSTVLPGTARHLSKELGVMVVSMPEFLTEQSWELDSLNPRMMVFGADNVPERNAVRNIVNKINAKIKISTDTVTAETIKYAFNTFFATKVVWANQLYDICQINGADYGMIREALHRHPWGSKHHFKVMHKGGRGAGGKCLPKDLKAFAKYGNLDLLKEVDRLNDGYLSRSKKQ